VQASSSGQTDDMVFMRAYARSQIIPPDDTGISGQGTFPTNWTVVVSPGAVLGSRFDQLWLVENSAGSTFEIDEIRVGTTWQSVTRVGYGAGCFSHHIGVTNRPVLGASNFSIDLHGARPISNALLLLGLSPLDLQLGGIGVPSCSLLTSAEVAVPQVTD